MMLNTSDPTWIELVEAFSEKLRLSSERLQAPTNDRDTDQYTKGQIAAFKEILNYKNSRDKRILTGTGRVS